MANFCKQCSLETFGQDFRELADLVTPEQYALGRVGLALCEGCGAINVNPDGVCVSPDCLKAHSKNKRPANKRIITRTITSGSSGYC